MLFEYRTLTSLSWVRSAMLLVNSRCHYRTSRFLMHPGPSHCIVKGSRSSQVGPISRRSASRESNEETRRFPKGLSETTRPPETRRPSEANRDGPCCMTLPKKYPGPERFSGDNDHRTPSIADGLARSSRTFYGGRRHGYRPFPVGFGSLTQPVSIF